MLYFTQNLDVICVCVSNQNQLRRISPKILGDQFGCMNALDMMNKPLISFHVIVQDLKVSSLTI